MGCAALPSEQRSETQEIIDNLVEAGFPADDITVVDGIVYVGRDAQVSLAASREMVGTDQSGEEQYRTNNLVDPSITRICVDGSTFTGVFSTALDLAIQNYEELPLRFSMVRMPTVGCSALITAVIVPGLNGGQAGFPQDGAPFPTIFIGGALTPNADLIEHVITHELGHTIGFRHTDFFDRRISCGQAANEDNSVGAVHIPGTPMGATFGGSLMNACFRANETGEFANDDVVALLALYPAPVGVAFDFPIAFQANTTELHVEGPGLPGRVGFGMAAGTSPSFTRLANGGFQVAFQANTGTLWTFGTLGTGNLGFGMAPGTSPSITAVGSGYQIAFQANTTQLFATGSFGTVNLGFGMAGGTSPSITALGASYQIAFQANTGVLWTAGPAGTGPLNLGMAGGTSPSITALNGFYQIAFQANTTQLFTTGANGPVNLGFGMAAGTSPSITALSGGYQIAFQANTTQLFATGVGGTVNFGFGMRSGTSPSISTRADGGYNIAFQANTGSLWRSGTGGSGDLMRGMSANSSPSTN